MSWLSRIFTGTKAVDTVANIANTGMSMLEESIFTKEERSKAALATHEVWLKVQEAIAMQSHGTAVSRRWVAWGVMSLVWIIVVYAVRLISTSETTIVESKHLLSNQPKITALFELALAVNLGWAFAVVLVFYFGPHLAERLK